LRIPEAASLITLDGRYHVLGKVAAGGMGEVYRAHDAVLEREVAIKVLHPSLAGDAGFVERFRREARSAAGLNHANIVHVHDWGAVDGIYFMVMEYVRGQSLRDVLNAEGMLAPAAAADVLVQVLAALDHAHRKGIVHRDVKPENIMLTPDGIAKVADFGLARAYADARSTQTGMVTGTVQYLAPEQLQGEPADPRTDLYSLGIVAYELLTGRVPFEGETQMAIAYRHLRERVPRASSRNPAVPAGLDGGVASMSEKDRELRPESAAEARRDLISEAATLPAAAPVAELVHVAPDAPDAPAQDDHPSARAETVTISRARGRRGRRRLGRRVLLAVLGLLAVVTAAWGVWTYLVPHTVAVPNVVGADLTAAEHRIGDLGLHVRLGDGRYSKTVAKGDVVKMSPAPGTDLHEGARVLLVPSLGPPPVPVPDLTGKTVEQARPLLIGADLGLGEVHHRYDDRFDVGRIVAQSGGAKAPWGSSIDVWISKGPKPVPLPKVVGGTLDQADAALGAWVVTVNQKFSDAVPKDQVIAQHPAAGTALQPGQTVTIVVSLGPRTFPMPDVVGMSKDAAAAKLQDLGLKVGFTPIPGSNADTVVSTLPTAGTTVRYAQVVTLFVA
ncbi:MAG: Stk1 family PASTA domain-containing Ser/Thr kinase, partial [Actinomycetota bacterium]